MACPSSPERTFVGITYQDNLYFEYEDGSIVPVITMITAIDPGTTYRDGLIEANNYVIELTGRQMTQVQEGYYHEDIYNWGLTLEEWKEQTYQTWAAGEGLRGRVIRIYTSCEYNDLPPSSGTSIVSGVSGNPISKPISLSKINTEYNKGLSVSDYKKMRLYNIKAEDFKYVPSEKISFGFFENTKFYLEPYPAGVITISQQPKNKTVYANTGNTQLVVSASVDWQESKWPRFRDDPSKFEIFYKWQRSSNKTSWENIAGGTNSTLDIDTADSNNNGVYFRCVVTAKMSAVLETGVLSVVSTSFVTSDSAKLTLNVASVDAPTVTVNELKTSSSDLTYDYTGTTVVIPGSASVFFETILQGITGTQGTIGGIDGIQGIIGVQALNGSETIQGTTSDTIAFSVSFPSAQPGRTVTSSIVGWQWEVSSDDQNWSDFSASGDITIDSEKKITFANLTDTSLNGTFYRLRVTAEQAVENPTEVLSVTEYSNSVELSIGSVTEGVPTIEISSYNSVIYEGASAQFQISAPDMKGEKIYWRISGNPTSEFDETAGNVTVKNDGTAVVTLNATADGEVESDESYTLEVSIDTGFSTSTDSASFTIQGDPPTFEWSPAEATITEGESVTFNLTSERLGKATLGYRVLGAGPEHFEKTNDNFNTKSDGTASVTLFSKVGAAQTDQGYTEYPYILELNYYGARANLTVQAVETPIVDPILTVYQIEFSSTPIEFLNGTGVTREGTAELTFVNGSTTGYTVAFDPDASTTSVEAQWEYKELPTGSWKVLTTTEGPYTFPPQVNDDKNGYEYRYRVTATNDDRTVTKVSGNSVLYNIDIEYSDPVAQLISVSSKGDVSENEGEPIVEIKTKNANGKKIKITTDNLTEQFGADYEKIVTVFADKMSISLLDNAQPFNKLTSNTETITVETHGDNWNESQSVSTTIVIENIPEEVSASVIETQVNEGSAIKFKISGKNVRQQTGWSWEITGIPTEFLPDSSGTFDLAFEGNSITGKYIADVSIATTAVTDNYDDQTGLLTVTAPDGTKHLDEIEVTIVNTDQVPVQTPSVAIDDVSLTFYDKIVSVSVWPGGAVITTQGGLLTTNFWTTSLPEEYGGLISLSLDAASISTTPSDNTYQPTVSYSQNANFGAEIITVTPKTIQVDEDVLITVTVPIEVLYYVEENDVNESLGTFNLTIELNLTDKTPSNSGGSNSGYEYSDFTYWVVYRFSNVGEVYWYAGKVADITGDDEYVDVDGFRYIREETPRLSLVAQDKYGVKKVELETGTTGDTNPGDTVETAGWTEYEYRLSPPGEFYWSGSDLGVNTIMWNGETIFNGSSLGNVTSIIIGDYEYQRGTGKVVSTGTLGISGYFEIRRRPI